MSKDCYGESWEAQHVECAGGLDPLYTHPINGKHERDRCEMYEQCGQLFRSKRASAYVPASNLIRTSPTTTVYTPPAPQPQRPIQPYAPPAPPIMVQPRPTYPTQYTVPQPAPQQQQLAPPAPLPQQFYPAVYAPVQTLLPHEAAPYLTTHEARVDGVATWKRILVESLRAGAKGMLQQGAYIVDHTPWYLK